jgi:hypothetical protein
MLSFVLRFQILSVDYADIVIIAQIFPVFIMIEKCQKKQVVEIDHSGGATNIFLGSCLLPPIKDSNGGTSIASIFY